MWNFTFLSILPSSIKLGSTKKLLNVDLSVDDAYACQVWGSDLCKNKRFGLNSISLNDFLRSYPSSDLILKAKELLAVLK